MKIYKLPFRSRVAMWVSDQLPIRVKACIWIDCYNDIDQYMEFIRHHDDDGSISCYDGIGEIRVENLRRKMFREYLKATTIEVEKTK